MPSKASGRGAGAATPWRKAEGRGGSFRWSHLPIPARNEFKNKSRLDIHSTDKYRRFPTLSPSERVDEAIRFRHKYSPYLSRYRVSRSHSLIQRIFITIYRIVQSPACGPILLSKARAPAHADAPGLAAHRYWAWQSRRARQFPSLRPPARRSPVAAPPRHPATLRS